MRASAERRASFARQLRHDDDRTFTARDFDRAIAVERVQGCPSSARRRLLGVEIRARCAGCKVEMACL